jgi:enamine deaminase RidA (YjgF/YER057c/UK114 family)
MRKTVHSPHAPKAIGPYSQAILTTGEMVFTSGQLWNPCCKRRVVPSRTW